MLRHVRTVCKSVGRGVATQIAASENKTLALRQEIDALKRQVETLERNNASPPARGAGGPNTVNQITVHNNNHHQEVHFHLNVFGRENTTHISREKVGELLTRAQEQGGGDAKASAVAAVRLVAEAVRSGKGNQTAYQRNKRAKEALVVGEDSHWIIMTLSAVLNLLTTQSINILWDRQPVKGNLARFNELLGALKTHEGEMVRLCDLIEILRRNKAELMHLSGPMPRAGAPANAPARPEQSRLE